MLRIFRCLFRGALLLSVLALLCAVGAYIYLVTAGIPRPVLGRLLTEARRRNLDLNVTRVRLTSPTSVLLEGVRFDARLGSNGAVRAAADRLALEFSLVNWGPARRPALRRIDLDGCAVAWDGPAPGSRGTAVRVAVTNLSGRYDVQSDALHFCDFSGTAHGISVRGYGRIAFGDRASIRPRPRPPRLGPGEWPAVPEPVLHWVSLLLSELQATRFGRPPSATISFDLHPGAPAANRAVLFAEGVDTTARGIPVQEWHVAASFLDGRIVVPSAFARAEAESVFLSGTFDIRGNELQAKAAGRLLPSRWLGFLPGPWRDWVGRQGLAFAGPAEFDVRIPPTSPTNAIRHVEGTISLRDLRYEGFRVEQAYVSFRREDDLLSLNEFRVIAGEGRLRGPVSGRGTLELRTGGYELAADVGTDPRPFLTRVSRGKLVFPPMEFRSIPPAASVSIEGRLDSPRSFHFRARTQASDFLYNGEPVVFFDSHMEFTNDTLSFSPMLVVRDEGRAEGELQIAFLNRTAQMRLTSTIPPRRVARMIGPAAERAVLPYRFDGRISACVTGIVDYATGDKTDLEAFVEGERLGIGWFMVDSGSCRLGVRGQTLEIDNARAVWHGGELTGRVSFHDILNTNLLGYSASGTVSGVSLSGVAGDMGSTNQNLYDAKLYGWCDVSGGIGAGRGATAAGRGRAMVEGENLLQIPLFGGLSKVLSLLAPGLGYAKQTKFRASFDIRDGRAHTEEAELLGTVISVRGRGSYGFDESLDFRFGFIPLKEGFVAQTLQWLTLPATKLLEMNLEGSIRQPVWQIARIPNELRRLFEGFGGGASKPAPVEEPDTKVEPPEEVKPPGAVIAPPPP